MCYGHGRGKRLTRYDPEAFLTVGSLIGSLFFKCSHWKYAFAAKLSSLAPPLSFACPVYVTSSSANRHPEGNAPSSIDITQIAASLSYSSAGDTLARMSAKSSLRVLGCRARLRLVAEKQPAELAPRMLRMVGMVWGEVCARERVVVAREVRIVVVFMMVLLANILIRNGGRVLILYDTLGTVNIQKIFSCQSYMP